MKALELSIDELWNQVAEKTMGASAHCELWCALGNISGHELPALGILENKGLLEDISPLLSISKSAHQCAMTMAICSLYELPSKTDCITLAVYRSKIEMQTLVPPELNARIDTAYQLARQLYPIRTGIYAHMLAQTCDVDQFERAGLTNVQVIGLVEETKHLVLALAHLEGRRNFDLHTDRDVKVRLSRINESLMRLGGSGTNFP